jgi:hypothetical protein
MYNKKYILEEIEEFGRHNPLYDDIEGATCYPAYFNVGEHGWFLYEYADCLSFPHRVRTSVIRSVEYFDGHVIVDTQNTKFKFKQIE